MGRLCLAAAICLALAGAAPGMSPTAADGPGIPKRTYPAGDFRTLSVIQAPAGFAHGACAMINGYLFVPYFKEGARGGGFDFYDISNPAAPVRVKRVSAPGIREPHTIASSNGYNADIIVLQGTDGVEFWNVSDPINPFLVKHLALSGIDSSEFEGYAGVWWTFWQAPILYVGANSDGLYVVDATNLQSPTQKRIPISSLGGFTVGSVFAVGNVLYLASTENADADTNGNGRFTTMDISDPRNPKLIKTFAIPANPYSMLINGDRMHVGGVSQHFHTVDVSDPANLRKIDDINLGGSNGNYVSFQDGFVHAGYTTKVVKLDVRGTTIVNSGSGGSSIGDKDFNFAIPLGNMVYAGNDHPAGSPIMVHQGAPDNTGPSVNMINPKNGATNQAVTSRVGLTLTDDIDLRSLSTSTVIVRPRGGAALRGKYSVQQNVVSFFPDAPLAAGTTYEVVVPAGGVKDWSGNGAPSTFTSTFTTAGGAPPPPPTGRDALLVVGNTTLTAGDTLYRNRLQALGYAVQVVDDSVAGATQASGKDVVVISESCEVASGVGPRFRTVAVPIVTPELGIFSDLGMVTSTGTATGTTVTITDPAHAMAAGLSGTVTVLTSSDRIHWGVPAASARKIATAPGTSNYAIFGYASGDAMVGLSAPARRVGFFPEDTAAAKLNANGGRLFDAAVTWADNIATAPPPPPPTTLAVTIATPAPRLVNQAATLSVQSSTAAEFSWDFGDGSAATPYSTSTTATHTYTRPGQFAVQVFARTAGGATSGDTATQVVHYPAAATKPTASSTILHAGTRVWVVNPDSDSVSAVDTTSFLRLFETPVGKHPRTLALAPDNTVWVVNQDSATITVVSSSGAVIQTIALPAGSRPFGIAFGPAGAYVTLEATGRLLTLSPTSRTITSNVAVGPTPRGIAILGDRVFVTRFISPDHRGEVVEVGTRTFGLAFDAGPDSERSGRGVPNYLSTIAISPDGRRAWVPSKKDNIARGQSRDGLSLTFESSVRTIVSQLDLTTNVEGARLDINDNDMASAVAFSRNGDLAFVATQGTNTVQIVQVYDLRIIGQIRDVGLAPQGLVLEGNRLYVQGFMSRTLEVFDVAGVINYTSNTVTPLATVDTNIEKLPAQVLRGKQIFYNAGDRRMSRDGYISCASCHLDGGEDGRVWDFTDRGEGLRNTISLLGRRGTGHGNVHWTANFDEIQDFENDIRLRFGGLGFMTDTQFNTGTRSVPLGDRKAGVSADLDALSAYVSSLAAVPVSPYRGSDVSAGRAIFRTACATCHAGADFTDKLKHDGFDTPTLKGVWQTPPYLHDGSAATLTDVFTSGHGNLAASQIAPVVEYVRQIDDLEAPAPAGRLALLVVGDPNGLTPGDSAIRSRLQGLGFTVVTEGDGSTSSASASGKAVVVIAESVISTTVGSTFTNVAVPVVTSEPGLVAGGGLTTSATVTIADPSHPMAAGLSGTVTVTTSAASLTSGTSAQPVATANGRPVLFGTDGAPARRVVWFAGNSSVPLLNANGWKLFDAAVTWATSGSQTLISAASATEAGPADALEEGGKGWTGGGGGCGLLGVEIILILLVTAARRRQHPRHGRREAP